MKAKLEFDLPEEKEEFRLAVLGSNFYSQLIDIDNFCRAKLKNVLSDCEMNLYQQIRDMIELPLE